MGRIGIIKHENYEAGKLDKIFRIIENAAKSGENQFYEVFLDDMKIIPRTSDPEQLNSFTEFVDAHSERLTVYLYYGSSKHSDTYNFYFKGVPANKVKSQTLSGVNLDELEKQQKDKILKEIHNANLEKENAELKARIEELEDGFVKQQEYWEKMKDDKLNSYGEIGSAIFLKAISHPWVIKKLPFLDVFKGLGEAPKEEGKEKTGETEEQTATFKRKGEKSQEATSSENNLNEEDQALLAFFHDLYERFGKEKTEVLFAVINALSNNPHALNFANKQIQNFLKGKPKQDNKAA